MAGGSVHASRRTDGGAVVEVHGELDVATCDRLREALDEAARLRPGLIIVDMLHVTFIDSTGIGALAGGYNMARGLGIPFTVRHPSPIVARQLHNTGLYDVLVTEDRRRSPRLSGETLWNS